MYNILTEMEFCMYKRNRIDDELSHPMINDSSLVTGNNGHL